METNFLPEGHGSKGSLTSLIKMTQPHMKSPSTDQSDWPHYLRMQSPTATITYESGSLGDLKIRLPPIPASIEETDRLAHYIWDSGLLLCQLIAGIEQHNRSPRWDVRGQCVVELGSGTGLVGIVCALAGAERTVLTDYPSPPHVLENISANVDMNVFSRLRPSSSSALEQEANGVSVRGHIWGELENEFAEQNARAFTRVLATGCLFLLEQHGNLARSMAHFLAKSPEAEVWAVSGFFLGRKKLAGFFEVVRGFGLEIRDVFEQNAVGERRAWSLDRGVDEDEEETVRQGWLLVAIIGYQDSGSA